MNEFPPNLYGFYVEAGICHITMDEKADHNTVWVSRDRHEDLMHRQRMNSEDVYREAESKLKQEVDGLRHELKMLTSGLPDALKRERMKVYDFLINSVDERRKKFEHEKVAQELLNCIQDFIKNHKEVDLV